MGLAEGVGSWLVGWSSVGWFETHPIATPSVGEAFVGVVGHGLAHVAINGWLTLAMCMTGLVHGGAPGLSSAAWAV